MDKKIFVRPLVEIVYFNSNVLTASSCACYDDFFCPTNYRNCTNDGANCSCGINHDPAKDNCTKI